MHEAVVAPGPDDTLGLRRLRDREDRAVVLDPGVVARDRAPRPLLLRLVVASEVGTDDVPALAAVASAEHDVPAVVHRLAVVGRDVDGGRPLEAVAPVFDAVAREIRGIGADVPRLAGLVVVAGEDPEVLAGVDDARIVGIVGGVAGFSAPDALPVFEPDSTAAQGVARAPGRAEVLHRPRDLVGHRVVHGHVIELRDGQVGGAPGLAAVGAQLHAAVVAVDHAPRVPGVDPHVVVVAVAEALRRA